MKTGTKVVLGIALSFSLLGIFFGVYGYYTGGVDDIRAKAEATTQKHSKTFDNLDSVTFSGDSNLVITSGNVTKPTMTYTKTTYQTAYYDTNYTFKDGVLSITSQLKDKKAHISGGLLDLASNTVLFNDIVTLTLPKNSSLKSISTAINNHLYLKNLSLKDTTVEVEAYLEVTNANLDNVKVTSNYATIDMRQSTLTNTNISIKGEDFEGNGLTFKQKNSIIADSIDISLNDYNLTVTHNAEDTEDITKRLTASTDNTLNLTSRDDAITVN